MSQFSAEMENGDNLVLYHQYYMTIYIREE